MSIRRESGRPGFVRSSGMEDLVAKPAQGVVGIGIEGLSPSEVQDIVNSPNRIGPDEVCRFTDEEINQSWGPERNFGALK